MAHEDWYYKYGDHMPDGTPDTRWQTAPTRWLNRGHDAAVDGAMGVLNAGRAVKDFVGNTTFNPLPYGDMANSAYEGIQNSYGGWLDDKYDAVADWYNPQPDMMAGGPMSRNGRATAAHPYAFDPKGYDIMQNGMDYPIEYIPSHEIPGYDRMVNEGYDSWSPSDSTRSLGEALPYMTGVLAQEERQLDKEATRSFSRGLEQGIQDTRSDWQKWKDSFKQGWEAK